MTTSNFLVGHPAVILPPLSKDVELPTEPIILLKGSTFGIYVDTTWHEPMVNELVRAGLPYKIYVPYCAEQDMGDIDTHKKKNDDRAFAKSIVQIYWHPKDPRIKVDFLDFNPFLVDKIYEQNGKKFLIGTEEEKDPFGIECRSIPVYRSMKDISRDVVRLCRMHAVNNERR